SSSGTRSSGGSERSARLYGWQPRSLPDLPRSSRAPGAAPHGAAACLLPSRAEGRRHSSPAVPRPEASPAPGSSPTTVSDMRRALRSDTRHPLSSQPQIAAPHPGIGPEAAGFSLSRDFTVLHDEAAAGTAEGEFGVLLHEKEAEALLAQPEQNDKDLVDEL